MARLLPLLLLVPAVWLQGDPPRPAAGPDLVAVRWTPLYVSDRPLDRNVFLETVMPDSAAAGLILADRLACVGEFCGFGSGFGLLPREAIAWEARDPAIPRRVIVEARIACRKGWLEHLLSQFEAGKDHESLLSGTFDAQSIHLGLLACGLKPGKPAQFWNDKQEQDFKPPTGDPVRVDMEYLRDGRWVRHSAKDWVVSAQTKKPLTMDWVFAGSFITDWEPEPGKPQRFYAANTGRVICVTNFTTALLDLPFQSAQGSPDEGGLDFMANTEKTPERGTPVRLILEPMKPAVSGPGGRQ